jgi:hypothetical protein
MKSYLLLRATLGQYRSRFREYFPALFLVCAIAYLAYFLLESASQSLLQPVRPAYSIFEESPPLFLANPLVRRLVRALFLFAEYFVCWSAFVFSLAAISGEMLHEGKDSTQLRLSAAFQRVWSARRRALLALSFFAAGITTLFYEFVRPIFFRPLMTISYYSGLSPDAALTAAKFIGAVSMVLICVVLAKMALGVPELVEDHDIAPGRAVRNSLVATMGWEWAFAVLFFAIAAAGFAIELLLDAVFQSNMQFQQLTALGREAIQGARRAILSASALMLVTTMFANLYFILRYGAESAGPRQEPMGKSSAAP